MHIEVCFVVTLNNIVLFNVRILFNIQFALDGGALCTSLASFLVLSCGYQQGDNIGITSSTCRHCTLE